MEKNKLKISIAINIIIVIFTIFASFMMFTGFKIMDAENLLESTALGMFRFFTVDSNLFMGIVASIFLIDEIKVLKGTKNEVSTKMYILKLTSTTAVSVTFITVVAYLGPIAKGGIISLLMNSNLFFHLLVPVLSIISFIFFERTDKLKLRTSLFGILPTFVYSIYYLINVLVHMENGKVSPLYDWYWFVQGGMHQIFIVFPVMLLASYLTCLALWRANKKKIKNN